MAVPDLGAPKQASMLMQIGEGAPSAVPVVFTAFVSDQALESIAVAVTKEVLSQLEAAGVISRAAPKLEILPGRKTVVDA